VGEEDDYNAAIKKTIPTAKIGGVSHHMKSTLGGYEVESRGHQYAFSVGHINRSHSRSNSEAHIAGGRRRHIGTPMHVLQRNLSGYGTIKRSFGWAYK
jgi:hypothetical protein